jgi:hypothetical protein
MAYYDVLGLDSQCTQDEIKKAYRRLAIKVSRPSGRGSVSLVSWMGSRETKCREDMRDWRHVDLVP